MRARVVSSIGLSLVLHVGGLVALSFIGARAGSEPGGLPQVGMAAGFEADSGARGVLVPLVVPPLVEPEIAKAEPEPEVKPEPKEMESPLGIEDGHETAEAWKGAREETENLAPKSKVDQAARAIDPKSGQKDAGPEVSSAGAGAAVANSAERAASEAAAAKASEAQASEALASVKPVEAQPLPVQPEEKQDRPRQPEPEQLKPQQPEPQQTRPVEQAPEETAKGEVELPRAQPQPQQVEEQQPLPEQRAPVQEKPVQPLEQQLKEPQRESTSAAPTPPVNGTEAGAPSTPAVQGGGAAGVSKASSPDAEPGKKADEESPAASIVGSLVFKPGEPLAGKGLRVWTVTPKYSVTTRFVARPKNAVVLITFGRDGKVLKAVFKERTGYEDVDKPLLEAVYRWTARGEALTKIPADNPNAGVTYSIKFLMEAY